MEQRAWIRGLLAVAAQCALVTACVAPLRQPPSLLQLAGRAEADPVAQATTLRSAAKEAFDRRTVEAAGEAATLWFRAAAADQGLTQDLQDAARALTWITEHHPEATARRHAAERAVHAAQWCLRRAAAEPACDYWLGAALGVQARERSSTGLRALPEIEAAFRRAAAASPLLLEAGPDRALALLYLRAPAWPTGPGDPDLALVHARRAVQLAPGSPANHLALAEVMAAHGDAAGRHEALETAAHLARGRLADHDPEAQDWLDSVWRQLEP